MILNRLQQINRLKEPPDFEDALKECQEDALAHPWAIRRLVDSHVSAHASSHWVASQASPFIRMFQDVLQRPAVALATGEVNELRKTVQVQGKAIQAQDKKLAVHEQRLAALEALLIHPQVPEPGAFERWLETEAPKQYGGKFIAHIEGVGVEAFADSLSELMASIGKHPRIDDMAIVFVPNAAS